MRIQFVKERYLLSATLVAEFHVSENLTKREKGLIIDYIFQAIDGWDENDPELTDTDYYLVCEKACKKYIPNKLIKNPVVQTFYF